MPELPDLVYIEKVLRGSLAGATVSSATVCDPVVLRVAVPEGFASALSGRTLEGLRRHGPFLVLEFPPLELVVHFMLAGRYRLMDAAPVPGRTGRDLCFSLAFSDGRQLDYLDEKRMGKVYLVRHGDYKAIPGFITQGIDVLSEDFSEQVFRRLISGCRKQVRMKVRNRKGEPCPVCGTTIRRAGVLGHDAFFCPRCQATKPIRPSAIPWT